MKTITPAQFETLKKIATEINAEITAYNDANNIVHQVISVSAHSNEDEDDGLLAYFEVTTFRTHSAAEETLAFNAIAEIGKRLSAAGLPDVIEHSGDSTYTAGYTIAQ